jgi:very-short-patch-repair endonuclease
MDLLLKYFNIVITKNFLVKLKFKNEFKVKHMKNIRKIIPKVNGPSLEYYQYHLGGDTGRQIFNERKKYFGYQKLAELVIANKLYDNDVQLAGIQKKVLQNNQNIKKGVIESQPKTWHNPDYVSSLLKKRAISMSKLDFSLNKSKKAKEYWASDRAIAHREKISKNHKEGKSFSLVKWQIENGVKHSSSLFLRKGKNLNYLEYLFSLMLDDFSIFYEIEQNIKIDNINYFPDFFIPRLRLIIELFGDVWHCNPSLVKVFENSKDISPFKKDPKIVWQKDKERQDTFLKAGYRYLVFWENEFSFGRLERIYKFLIKIEKELHG